MVKNYCRLLITLVVLSYNFTALATHIVGGALTYEHLGGSSYKVSLRLYRDCGPGNVAYPNSTTIQVRNGAGGTTGLNFTMPRIGIVQLDPPIDTCAFDPGICVEEAIYTSIVSLPPSPNGYHLYWGICCRNGSIDNLNNPLSTTELFHTYIPNNNLLLTNSSPVWTNFPPVYVCQGQDVNFDHSATDPDGDSLVYSFYAPYQNTVAFSGALPPDNFTPASVNYSGTHSATNPVNLVGPFLQINPQTGLISGQPQNVGQFVVGVKVEEWRDGQKIGVTVRDFQFNVVNCPPPQQAGITAIPACDGLTVNFVNGSDPGAQNFLWDFGNAGATSTQENPSYTYPGLGTYTVELIAQVGTNCADTATYNLTISTLNSDWSSPDTTCIGSSMNFTDNSTSAFNSTINSWQWDFGDGGTSTLPNPSHTFNMSGDFTVQLVVGSDAGCTDTLEQDVYIQPLPTVNVGPDTTACENNPLINLNGIVNNAAGGIWVGDGGSFSPSSNFLNVNYTPSQNEIDAGETQIILSTTGNAYCPSTSDTLMITYIPGPNVSPGDSLIEVCDGTPAIQLNGTIQFGSTVEWSTSGSGTFNDNELLNPIYFPSTGDFTNGGVMLYIESTNNGFCEPAIDSVELSFFAPPTVSIDAPDTTCASYPIALNANSTTGNGIWETFGDGFFQPSDTGNVITYEHGPNDESNGLVTIAFQTIDNGGCVPVNDTVTIVIIPSPEAGYTYTDVCFNEATVFTDTSTSVEPIVSWEWFFGGGSFSNAQNPSFTFDQPGNQDVTFVVTSSNGCTDTLQQDVIVHFLPEANFYTPAPCLNGGTQFIDSTTVDSASITTWNWSFGDGNTSDVQDPENQFPEAGLYDVTLIVGSEFGCLDTLTISTDILPGPDAAFNADPSATYLFEEINFTDETTSNETLVNWDWDFGDGSPINNEQNPNYAYDQTGTFDVILIVTDEFGCIDTASNEVYIYMPPQVPNAFSPNNDGENDILHVLGGPFDELEFIIYNNWGEVIFTSNDENIGWDGTFKGQEQPLGVYVYTVRAVTADGEEHLGNGDVTLIR